MSFSGRRPTNESIYLQRLRRGYLFLFYGTLRASTLLPTVMTLLGKKLTGKGVFVGVLTALCVGLPIFAYGNLAGLPAVKAAGSLTTVLSSGIVAAIASRKAVRA